MAVAVAAVPTAAQSQRSQSVTTPTKAEVMVRVVPTEDRSGSPQPGNGTPECATDQISTSLAAVSLAGNTSPELSQRPTTPTTIRTLSLPRTLTPPLTVEIPYITPQLLQPKSAVSTASKPSTTFSTLPADILYLIATEFLPYDAILALRSTSSYLHHVISPLTLKRLRKRTVQQLLAEERVILDKWIEHGGDSRPTPTLNCYTCLQARPVTEFFADQCLRHRGVGRKNAGRRWCKPCGMKRGLIKQGRWYEEVSYGVQDRYFYEVVMKTKLDVDNHCAKCPPRRRVDGEPLWWGCVGCFEKDELQLQKQDSERRRDIRHHLRKTKLAIRYAVHPSNIPDHCRDLARWTRRLFGWSGITSRGWQTIYWFTDESPWDRLCRHCGRARTWVDDHDLKESLLGRMAKSTAGRLLHFRTKTIQGVAEPDTPEWAADCLICDGTGIGPVAKAIHPIEEMITDPTPNNHLCVVPSHHEVRCSRCWRANRSRRRRRYDLGRAYGTPLAEDQWCEGCQAERQRFIESERARNTRKAEMRRQRLPKQVSSPKVRPLESPGSDVNLRGLFEADPRLAG